MSDRERLKPESWLWHLLGLINPLIVISSNLVGGYWVATGVIYMLVLGPLFDFLLGCAKRARPARESGRPFELLLFVHAMLQIVVLLTLLYRASMEGSAWTTGVAALSTGLCSGASGIIVAHELGHRKPGSLLWWVGRFNLLGVLYLHFTTEHNFTHHKHVSTVADPATARYGESLWGFVARTIPGQFRDAVEIHNRKDRTGLDNPVYRGLLLQILLVFGIYATAGIWVSAAFVMQAAFAIFLLEYINYIRHYGLNRAVGEQLSELHSWQSEERWSRWTLLELTRHPAHHLKAAEPFWRLGPYDTAPRLPSGYYGMFWIAVIPPLWKRLVHPRLPPSLR